MLILIFLQYLTSDASSLSCSSPLLQMEQSMQSRLQAITSNERYSSSTASIAPPPTYYPLTNQMGGAQDSPPYEYLPEHQLQGVGDLKKSSVCLTPSPQSSNESLKSPSTWNNNHHNHYHPQVSSQYHQGYSTPSHYNHAQYANPTLFMMNHPLYAAAAASARANYFDHMNNSKPLGQNYANTNYGRSVYLGSHLPQSGSSSTSFTTPTTAEETGSDSNLKSEAPSKPRTSLDHEFNIRLQRKSHNRCACPNCLSGLNRGDSKKIKSHNCHWEGCNKTYGKTSHLKAHIRNHLNEKPFKCDFPPCTKAFTRSDELSRHRRVHTGDRRFKCKDCPKAFTRSDHLAKHSLTHVSNRTVKKRGPKGKANNNNNVTKTTDPTSSPTATATSTIVGQQTAQSVVNNVFVNVSLPKEEVQKENMYATYMMPPPPPIEMYRPPGPLSHMGPSGPLSHMEQIQAFSF